MNIISQAFYQELEPPLRTHLKNAYSCAALAKLAAAVGALVYVFTGSLPNTLLRWILGLGFMIALRITSDNGKNTKTRLVYFLSFAFLAGFESGPLLDTVIATELAVIPSAFLSTCLIFSSFTLASMFFTNLQYLYLGSALLSIMSVMSFVNTFMESYLVFEVQIYIGLAIMCACIFFETQNVMEEHRNGVKDYVWHAVCLFFEFIQIFRFLRGFLSDKESNKKKK